MSELAVIERLQQKTPEQRFLWILREEYNYLPKESEAILAEVEDCLESKREKIRPGQQLVILIKRHEKHGQTIKEADKVEIVWTIDAGLEDCRYEEQYGKQALRQKRIKRLIIEAVEQGGVATQEDLARVLHVSVRTIKRDFAILKQSGNYLASRGYETGIGRGQTHKADIIQRWLHGATYDQLVRHTHHSSASIQRYVRKFLQVVALYRRGFGLEEIAQLTQLGPSLAGQYLTIYQHNQTPACQKRLAAQLNRFFSPICPQEKTKKGAI